MKNINLSNWSVSVNIATVSLPSLHSKVSILKNTEFIYFQLTVTDSNMEILTFNFNTLEDVIMFTEDVVYKCSSKEEVLDKYQQMYKEGLFRLPGGIKTPKRNTITLTPDEVDQAIIEYFGSGKSYRISVKEKVYLDFHGQQQISFYLTEHLDYDGIKKDIGYMLTEDCIKNALSAYVEFYGYELVDFKYVGGIHKVGYYFDEDTPYYEGIMLNVKQKDVSNKKRLKKDIK